MIINSSVLKAIDDLESIRARVLMAIVAVTIFLALLPTQRLTARGQQENEEQDVIVSCNCVAFRLDDIQDNFLTNAQMKVINTFEQKNASLTVGVIGNYFGNDLAMVLFLKERIASNNNGSGIEVANHGWNHEDFRRFSKEEQSALMQQTNRKINEILNVEPIVFIPPYNNLNNNTIAALQENGFQYISGNTTSYPPSLLQAYGNSSSSEINGTAVPKSDTIFHFPSSAHTGDLNGDNTEWLGYSHDRTFAAINASLNELGYAVVTLHPQEFSLRNGTVYQNEIDDTQIRELELLIDDIRAAGFKIVTISQINEGYGSAIPEFPAYSIYAILAVSIVIAVWLSANRKLDLSSQSIA